MIEVTCSQMKNNFGKYLDLALVEGEIQIIKYNRVVAKLVATKKKTEDAENNKDDSNNNGL